MLTARLETGTSNLIRPSVFFLTKSKQGVEVRGEVSYLSDLNSSKSVWKRGRNVAKMAPERLQIGVSLKSAKTDDIKNLVAKHFGPNWREMHRLCFLNGIIPVGAKDQKTSTVAETDYLSDDDCECQFNEQEIENRV